MSRRLTPKRDVLRTALELHKAEERVANLRRSLVEAETDLKWASIQAKAARAALAASEAFPLDYERPAPAGTKSRTNGHHEERPR
jgi:hypothetical protein